MKILDEKGRCCGRKPIYYKGGSGLSPLHSPMYFCPRCDAEYGPNGEQRANWAWKKCEWQPNALVRTDYIVF